MGLFSLKVDLCVLQWLQSLLCWLKSSDDGYTVVLQSSRE